MTIHTRPNPFASNIVIEIVSKQPAFVIVRLYDRRGRFAKMGTWQLAPGRNVSILRDLESLERGNYILDAIDTAGNLLYKLTIVKKVLEPALL